MVDPPVLPPTNEGLTAPRSILAVAIFLLFGFTVVTPYFQAVPVGAASNLILTTSEILKAVLLLMVGYYFGTSQGSTRKDDVIATQAVAATTAAAVTAGTGNGGTVDPAGDVHLDPGDKAVAATTGNEDIPPWKR